MASVVFDIAHEIYQSSVSPISLEDRIDQYSEYRVVQCSCKTVQLVNPLLSTVGSLLTLPLAGRALEHTWIVLKTEKPGSEEDPSIVYLVAQSYKDTLGLRTVKNEEEADEFSKTIAGRERSADHRHIHTFKPRIPTTVGDVRDFMKKENLPYNMAFNNCQHFVSKFSSKFGDRYDSEIVERESRGVFVSGRAYVSVERREENDDLEIFRSRPFRDAPSMGEDGHSCLDLQDNISCSIL